MYRAFPRYLRKDVFAVTIIAESEINYFYSVGDVTACDLRSPSTYSQLFIVEYSYSFIVLSRLMY